ncbi:diguanylate cyclase [Lederbergia citrea]|uniref:Diguanylate cyclase n=1 Tax=Lederbergia citrea TaxID=2833581 RepID=A0A942UT37_9BACI|nr:diguanylate cyclase [Lederbergia citrea]MBS4178012.1 diguanylate cyclase [Lederbergia citrea]MBS4223474.1 diguanylate cyclase [Lederbergia citrea]
MLLGLIINFCILFTFSVLSYWPYQNRVRFRLPFPSLHPWFIGVMAGIGGIILMKTGVFVSDEVFVDSRTVVIAISGIFGGPIAPFLSALIIGVERIFIGGVTNTSMIAGFNSVFIGIVVSIISLKKPVTFQNVHYYFYFITGQTAAVLAFLLHLSGDQPIDIIYYIIFSLGSFFIVLFILLELDDHFKKLRQIEMMAETDFLTGLNNSRKFLDIAKPMTQSSRDPFSLVILDIDFFKKINDTYGHPVGDEVLRELGLRLKEAVMKANGIVSRIGGEEFTIILPGKKEAGALEIAETIRSEMEKTPFRPTASLKLPLTVSIGISTFPENGTNIQSLYKKADSALYNAKESGRNKIVHVNKIKT